MINYIKYRVELLQLAKSITKGRIDLAEDIVQETLIKAYKKTFSKEKLFLECRLIAKELLKEEYRNPAKPLGKLRYDDEDSGVELVLKLNDKYELPDEDEETDLQEYNMDSANESVKKMGFKDLKQLKAGFDCIKNVQVNYNGVIVWVLIKTINIHGGSGEVYNLFEDNGVINRYYGKTISFQIQDVIGSYLSCKTVKLLKGIK